MGQLELVSKEAQGLWDLLAEVRTSFPPEFRRRQGKQWFDHWKSRVKDRSLISKLANDESDARLFYEVTPSEEYLSCDTMDAFLTFVDIEATGDWTADYDLSISDLIIEGFLVAANESYRFLSPVKAV
ncbi:hypothetical protein [Puniceibacterium sp. IMCC21224]|uniref:hypothetical protein n=1 Tax=Puniceibacterium sp. IMCC21224 TaxID=1618204 RepID=UPI00064D9ADB|nr:hypothetical protein [Puniceibacterium sp. IMCC21224]KMK66431.1 hypothetical protein IMCC21224_111282 [Puniceibacterium sp. IMCC21224]